MAIKRSGIEFSKIIVVILHLKTISNEREQYGDQLQLQASGLILKLVPPTTTVPSCSQNGFLHKYFISNTTMNEFIYWRGGYL